MLTSKEELLKESSARGYKPEILEKIYRLLDIFSQILSVPYLKERLVLMKITIPSRKQAPATNLNVEVITQSGSSFTDKPKIFVLPGGPGRSLDSPSGMDGFLLCNTRVKTTLSGDFVSYGLHDI